MALLSPPPPIKSVHFCIQLVYNIISHVYFRNPEPKSRPWFGQIKQLLAGNHNYLLGWSDEDKQYGGEDAMKLGGRADCANNLYYDLQLQYGRQECANYLYQD